MRKYIILGWALLLMPLALQAAKVKIKFVDSDKKTLLNAESKLINKASGQETVAKANKKGEAEFEVRHINPKIIEGKKWQNNRSA